MQVPRVAIHTKPCDLICLDVWNGATSYIPMVEERPLTVEPDIYQQSESLLARILVRTHPHPTTWLRGTARCRAEYIFDAATCAQFYCMIANLGCVTQVRLKSLIRSI
jgi:hypothetical protein